MVYPIFNLVHSGQIIGKTAVKNAVSHRDLLQDLKVGTPSSFREKMSVHVKVYFDNVDE